MDPRVFPVPGLKRNWAQFGLLILINAFVGAMVGMERSIFPDFAFEVFGLESSTALLYFIVAFGVSKAVMNYFTGRFADRFGRRNLLLTGWVLVLPVPLILNLAESWNWVIVANLLLGISQGLTWSSTVVMKIDLVGEKDRGLAMGLNEFAGYIAVGIAAVISAELASKFGIRPLPFWMMELFAVIGLILSLFTMDTRKFVHQEQKSTSLEKQKGIFWNATIRNKDLSSITQAGLVNNLNDGMIWGLLPVYLIAKGYQLEVIGKLVSVYPIVWGLGQLFTGKLADHFSHKRLLFWGMLFQGLGILGLIMAESRTEFESLLVVLGLGTALVYPTFMTAVAARSFPAQRAENLGIFRFWRDLGYALGALISGFIADIFGMEAAILSVGIVTLFSALVIQNRMAET